jgi:hypothetical protein
MSTTYKKLFLLFGHFFVRLTSFYVAETALKKLFLLFGYFFVGRTSFYVAETALP